MVREINVSLPYVVPCISDVVKVQSCVCIGESFL